MKTFLDLPHQLIEAASQAETLDRFTIEQHGIRWVVLERMAKGHKRWVRAFPDAFAAIEYLFNKLPVIESEL